jgi:hypothetical protein
MVTSLKFLIIFEHVHFAWFPTNFMAGPAKTSKLQGKRMKKQLLELLVKIFTSFLYFPSSQLQ